MDVDLSTDLDALLPLVAPLMSGHSDLAIGTRLAPGARVDAEPKRELISRCYNRLLRARPARPILATRSAGSRRSAPTRPRSCCRSCRTRGGSSTPSCSCSRSAAGCGSTRCRSTGSRTLTRASTSSPTALADLRGVGRLLVHRSPGRRPALPSPSHRCSRHELDRHIPARRWATARARCRRRPRLARCSPAPSCSRWSA